jgi:diguanylate cyclase (GGDEF)-like protein
VRIAGNTIRPRGSAEAAPPARPPKESLVAAREAARRERLLDMQRRLRPYRSATFAVLFVGLAAVSPEIGWWWILPLAVGMVSFPVVDHFVAKSDHPATWIAIGWGLLPLLLADGAAITGGAESPALVLFALPAITLGARFEPRGIAIGTAYILFLMMVCTIGFDAEVALDHKQEMIAAVALVICAVILSGALVESDRAHRRRSTLDPLTGLYNRTALDQRLGELEGEPTSEAEGLSHALLLCDLDHFKLVNDRLGHAAGDAVLQDVAYTMRATLRAGDSIFRVGGEEILVVLPGADEAHAVEIAERLREAVRERRPVGVTVTISIGVAVSGAGSLDTEELVGLADAALYSAKAGGRDRVSVGPAPAPVSG